MPGAFGAADPLFLLLAALAAEAYLGGFGWGFGSWSWPRRRFAELLRGLQQRLDRPDLGERALAWRGGLLAAAVLLAALGAGQALALFTRHYPFAWALELLLLFGALRLRRNHRQAELLRQALARADAQGARAGLARLAAAELSPQRVERLPAEALPVTAATALERRFVDGAAAPALWFVLLGLPGLLGWMAIERAGLTLSGPALALPDPFGRPARRLLEILRWPAARLTDLLFALVERLQPTPPAKAPVELLVAAQRRHALSGLLLAAILGLLIVLRLLIRQL